MEKASTYYVNSIGSQEVENPQKPNILLEAKICSKPEDLLIVVITFGALPGDLQKPNILPKAKICSKQENLLIAVITFGSLLATPKSQTKQRQKA